MSLVRTSLTDGSTRDSEPYALPREHSRAGPGGKGAWVERGRLEAFGEVGWLSVGVE